MTRLDRALKLAKRRMWIWFEPGGYMFLEREVASLALDGFPAPPTRRKLPACTPVFKKGMPL